MTASDTVCSGLLGALGSCTEHAAQRQRCGERVSFRDRGRSELWLQFRVHYNFSRISTACMVRFQESKHVKVRRQPCRTRTRLLLGHTQLPAAAVVKGLLLGTRRPSGTEGARGLGGWRAPVL